MLPAGGIHQQVPRDAVEPAGEGRGGWAGGKADGGQGLNDTQPEVGTKILRQGAVAAVRVAKVENRLGQPRIEGGEGVGIALLRTGHEADELVVLRHERAQARGPGLARTAIGAEPQDDGHKRR